MMMLIVPKWVQYVKTSGAIGKSRSTFVGTGMEYWAAKDSGQLVTALEAGKVVYVDANEVQVKGTTSGKIKTYYPRIFDRTNQYSCMHQMPVVNKGDIVKKGDALLKVGLLIKKD